MKTGFALVHFVFATTWLGSAFFYSIVLWPQMRLLEEPQRRAFARSLRVTMTPLLAASALLTIVSGLVMMVQVHSLHPGSFSHTRWGVSLQIGAVASVAALVIAFVVEAPAARRALRAEGGATDQLVHLGRRERVARLVALAFLTLALVTMAVARYS